MYLLIPSAGIGRRMGSGRNKLLLTLRSQPLIAWTLLAAEASRYISWIGIIAQSADWSDLKGILAGLSLTKTSAADSGRSHTPGISLQRFAGAASRSQASFDSRWS